MATASRILNGAEGQDFLVSVHLTNNAGKTETNEVLRSHVRAMSPNLVAEITIDQANTADLDLQHEAAQAFNAALHYATQQVLPASIAQATLNQHRDIPESIEKLIVQCWIFGHDHDMPALQNAIMGELVALKDLNRLSRCYMDNIILALNSLPTGFVLRKLMAEELTLGLRGDDDYTDDNHEWKHLKDLRVADGFCADFVDAMSAWDDGEVDAFEDTYDRYPSESSRFVVRERYMVSE